TPSIHSTTTESGGVWSISDFDDTLISSTTPMVIWLDGDADDATTMMVGYVGNSVSSIPLYYNYVISHTVGSNDALGITDFDFYDSSSDADILYTIGISTTTIASNILINKGTFVAPTTTMDVQGDFENNSTFDANSGKVVMSGTDKNIDGVLTGSSAFYQLTIAGSSTIVTSSASTTDLIIDIGSSSPPPLTSPSPVISPTTVHTTPTVV
ncbi:MAG: hypothetical protein R3B60_03250, partial [Candidatus Paceibacterota bacterium]